ncbi:WecB/TagA/CpsF family glycosyltransferase [Vibrio sp. TRT 17S01]|uniref:WecB/TagA/CpsF family glycosyltransferase n=1 Tax=Vibrio sp. TRT 17S01 TaxID=3418505 RepID=UPI003CF7C3E1
MASILDKQTLIDESKRGAFTEELLNTTQAVSVGFLNQHGYNLIVKNTRIKHDFEQLDYLLRDGKGIEIACRCRKVDPKANMNGADFIPFVISKLIRSERPFQFFAYGTQEPWLEKGATSLFEQREFLSLDGFQQESDYVEHYAQYADHNILKVIVLAMGMPKQERVAELLKMTADSPALIFCGGAVIDFQAKRFSRAPEIFQKFGLEWLYRLAIEPKRLFRRYVIGIPVFFYHSLVQGK